MDRLPRFAGWRLARAARKGSGDGFVNLRSRYRCGWSNRETGIKLLFGIVASALSLVLAAGPAAACRVGPRPLIPIRPDRTPYDAVAEATVLSHDGQGAEIRYETIFYGEIEQRFARLVYEPADMLVVDCGPPRTRVAAGDRILVILGRHQGREVAYAWIPLDQAERADDFFALYRAETRPAVRRRLRERWHLVNRLGGPVPLTNPARWMAPYAGSLGFTGRNGITRATFEIADDGRIANCEIGWPDSPVALDGTLCEQLGGRRRFQPPFFARERRGWYEVRWTERVATGR